MPSISVVTLGCKLNQLESEAIAASFRKKGFSLLPWPAAADILVVNTCTVTSKAEQKARRIIRKALMDNPASFLIITGCYAQLDGPALAALEDEFIGKRSSPSGRRVFVVPGGMKPALLDLPGRMQGRTPETALIEAGLEKQGGEAGEWDPFAFNPGDFSFHSRSFLKVQDGCDHACSYCRVKLARGKSVSLDAVSALARLRELEERRYVEAVITGVNISQYRDSRGEACDLGRLLDFLLRGTSRIALRLSSLDPGSVNPELLAVLGSPRIRPHFHLSLQSGSGEILKSMRRRYGPEDAARAVQALRSCRDDPFIACDIIAGFPGESGEKFLQSYELCRRLDFAWIHAFPYSRRPGTEAAGLKDQVSERDAAVRVEALLKLAKQGRKRYAGRQFGKAVDAVMETQDRGKGPYIPAVSENYLRLAVPVPQDGFFPGKLLRCRIRPLPGDGMDRFDAMGEELTASQSASSRRERTLDSADINLTSAALD
ncbi:MAG: tRNA (N(6)-L-threonylcarbamoyladenosine(37)-C(2))-methylthiotransferase MtaB [Treponema sp.]|jgi:threonylcarbamoyladenosine tRNA methylthiotransferase MtaB|nr:tRNA (N(6)-L-threonylcarbamoyladenosine(37)-C(2))-methylthiotransferase MtaB [Treponema sp.]